MRAVKVLETTVGGFFSGSLNKCCAETTTFDSMHLVLVHKPWRRGGGVPGSLVWAHKGSLAEQQLELLHPQTSEQPQPADRCRLMFSHTSDIGPSQSLTGHSPRSTGWDYPRWRPRRSGRGNRYQTWSRTQISARPCPTQTCRDSCCLVQPQTQPPDPFSDCGAGRRSAMETINPSH